MQLDLNSYYKCPNCKSSDKKIAKEGYLNRYSEEISTYYSIDEKKFNERFQNLKCQNCNLIYKLKWFKKKQLDLIFNRLIPVHPKGWDRLSNKFTKKNFNYLVDKIIFLKKKKKLKDLNKTQREIFSFVDSIKIDKNIISLKKSLIKNFSKNNTKDILRISKILIKKIKKPEEFSRFKGFESKKLISHIQSKIGIIKSYSEIGCPLWGNLDFLVKSNVDCSFIQGNRNEFWGINCKKQNINCKNKINTKIKKIKNFYNCKFKQKKDFIGVFLYLDHVTNPIKFFKKIFQNYNSCGIILENSKSGIPVQHFSGWAKDSFEVISKKFGKRLDCSFKDLDKTDKSFFLLY